MAKETYRFLLRLPPAMRERLVEAAERSGRSLNAELVYRIEQSFDRWRHVRRLAAPGLAAAVLALSGVAGILAVKVLPAQAEQGDRRGSASCVLGASELSRPNAPKSSRACAVGSAASRDSASTGA
jgi:hypothetical protein